jgi:hypothetical protein
MNQDREDIIYTSNGTIAVHGFTLPHGNDHKSKSRS